MAPHLHTASGCDPILSLRHVAWQPLHSSGSSWSRQLQQAAGLPDHAQALVQAGALCDLAEKGRVDSLLSQTPPRRTIQAASVMQDPSHRSPCTSIYFGRKNYQKRIQTKYTFHSNELCKWVMQTGPGYTNRLCKWVLARSTLACRRLYAASTELSHAQQSHGHPCPP